MTCEHDVTVDQWGTPRDGLTPEAFVLSCQRCRPTRHLHGWHARELGAMVETLIRERDDARDEVERLRGLFDAAGQGGQNEALGARGERCTACGRPTYAGEDFNGPCLHDTDLACALAQRDEAIRLLESIPTWGAYDWREVPATVAAKLREGYDAIVRVANAALTQSEGNP